VRHGENEVRLQALPRLLQKRALFATCAAGGILYETIQLSAAKNPRESEQHEVYGQHHESLENLLIPCFYTDKGLTLEWAKVEWLYV
jgi:hypothetical protein